MHRYFITSAVGYILIASLMTSTAQAQPEVVPGEYLIKYRGVNHSQGLSKAMNKIGQKASLKGAFGHLGVAHIAMKPGFRIEELSQDPDVEYVEPNFILRKNSNEPGVIAQSFSRDEISAASYQGAFGSALGFSQSGSSTFRTAVQNSWSLIKPASAGKIVVAVIDTGADRGHYLFKPHKPNCNVNTDLAFGNQALWVNSDEIASNGMDDDGNGFIDDVNGYNFISNSGNVIDDDGHGTHVAGIVVGTAVDILYSCDESPIQIMPLKFLDGNGSGSTANAIRAMYYAVQNGAKVINNSWGGSSYSRSLHDAMSYAYSNDVVVVTAAGNSAQNNDNTSMYPANYDTPSNISVAALENDNTLAYFSNFGKSKVAVAAPGVDVNSSIPCSMGCFGVSSGTSMAAPFVAGLAALIHRENPNYNSYDIKNLLITQSDIVAGLSQTVFSSGVVSPQRVINAAIGSTSSVTSKASLPSYTPSYQSDRAPASSKTETAVGGCGLVGMVGGGSAGGSAGGMGMTLALMSLPLAVWFVLRKRAMSPESRRRFDRFKMNSQVRIKVGDRELTGQVSTISQGGLSFNVDEALERGGVVTMRIASPDGNEMIEVQGHIVWSEQSQSYGVQFDQVREGASAMIRQWTQSLMKT